MNIKGWLGFVAGLLFLFCMISIGASTDQDYASHITTDLGIEVNLATLSSPINATYKIIDQQTAVISWSFSKEGKGDIGFIYADGRILLGSQDKFSPSVKERLDSELKAAIDIVNSSQLLTEDQRIATEAAVYYSGGQRVDAGTWNRCGNILVESGRFSSSLFYYDKSKDADPSFANPWNNEGVALMDLYRYQEAITCYSEALNLSPNNSVILNNRGESFCRIKKFSQALDDLNRSCQFDPSNSLAWYNKGVVLSALGRYDEAQGCYGKSLEADSYNANAWNNKGVALARKGLYKDALSCFSNAATINPKLAGAWANGGIALQNLGLENKSKDAFSSAKALGYNQTKNYYDAPTMPPLILEEKKEKMPFFGITSTIILIYLGYIRRRISHP